MTAPRRSKASSTGPATEESVRERILHAAFKAFTEKGYASTSTLEIATRAKVSKRELYTLFGSKQAILVACISTRVTRRMRPPSDLPAPKSRAMLASMLSTFGAILMREVSHPVVMAMFRLAIAEGDRSPEVARTLDTSGRGATRNVLADLLARAGSAGLIDLGDPQEMARQYIALLWEDLMVTLLLRLRVAPSQSEIERRAAKATRAFLQLHPQSASGSATKLRDEG
jgi:AcrR family transcriptional regulator